MANQDFKSTILFLLLHLIHGLKLKDNTFCSCGKQLYPHQPFIAVWNSPTGGCNSNFSVPINLKRWNILADPLQRWDSHYITVFYGAQLGLYPYYGTDDGQDPFNDGLPQLVNLKEHLVQAKKDIMQRIPDKDYNGLVVIDWEPWRPLWDRNWNAKKIYKIRSIDLVRQRHSDWSMTDIVLEAKDEFETAARAMFQETIRLGKRLRPKALWGFYGFPDCFGQKKYDFQCTDEVKHNNDKIDWLFKESTALFPSIYLNNQAENPDYVKGRLRESFRVNLRLSQRYGKDVLPTFPYFRTIYKDDALKFNFLNKRDLYNTIGVASEMGAAGVVIWGNRNDENTSPQVCHRINSYIQDTLGPFIRDTKKGVEDCVRQRCFGKGHCVNKTHLNKDLKRLYYFKHELNSNCAKPKIEELSKRGEIPRPNIAPGDSRSKVLGKFFESGGAFDRKRNGTKHENSTVRFGMPLSDGNLDKLQLDLKGKTTKKSESFNSTSRTFNSRLKSEVPTPNQKHFAGNFIGSHLQRSKRTKLSLLPHMYVLIIGVSIAGAFLFSLIFVAMYYYLNTNHAVNVHKMARTPAYEAKPAKDKKIHEEQENWEPAPASNKDYEESDIEVDLDSLKSFAR